MGLFSKYKEKKQYLLEWQAVIMDDSPKKIIMTEQQLRQASDQRANNDIRIVQDCTKILSETVNPDVFFERFELLKEKAADLKVLEKYVKFKGATPTDALNEILVNEQEAIYDFIVRYYSATFDKAEKMKTERGKNNQFKKFYDSLEKYFDRMSQRNINYVKYKCQSILENHD